MDKRINNRQNTLRHTPRDNTHTHTHTRILFAIKEKEILSVTTWMDFEGIMLNEMSDR